MTDIPDYQRIILERYLARRQAWEQEGKTPPEKEQSRNPQRIVGNMSIDDLIRHGKPFENTEKDKDGNWIGLPKSLQATIAYVGGNGVIASMPFLIAGKSQADMSNYLWKNWYSVLSEEDVGIDKKGLYVPRGKPVLLAVHGGGLLTSERIVKAYADGLTPQRAARYDAEEFDNLLQGRFPNGETIKIYTLDDIKNKKIIDPFGRYAVAIDFELAKTTASGYHDKVSFLANPVVLIRAGTPEYLEPYFDKAKNTNSEKKVGSWHRFTEIDPKVSQGRVLFVDDDDHGLDGNDDLDCNGRFVGVSAGGARRT